MQEKGCFIGNLLLAIDPQWVFCLSIRQMDLANTLHFPVHFQILTAVVSESADTNSSLCAGERGHL